MTRTRHAPAALSGVSGLLAAGAVALVIRLVVALNAPPPPLVGDALGYHQYASALVEKGEYREPSGDLAARPPGFPLLLAAVYATLGTSPRLVQVLQCVLGAAACVFVAGLARGLKLPAPWPIALGLAAAVYYPMIEPCGELLSECVYLAFLAFGFFALYSEAGAWVRSAVFGAALGAAALARPEALLLAVSALAVAPLSKLKMQWKHAAAGALALGLVLAPWLFRNSSVLGRPVLSSRGGISLYAGLRLPLDRFGHREEFFQPPAEAPELDRDAQYSAGFRELFARTPSKLKALAYAFNLATHLYPFLPGFDATFFAALPLWLLGLALSWTKPELRPIAAAVIVSLAVYTVFGGPASRYRNTYAPLQVALAGSALFWLSEKKPALYRFAPHWAGLNVGLWAFQAPLRQVALWLRDAVFR